MHTRCAMDAMKCTDGEGEQHHRSSTYANLKVSLSIGNRLNEGTTRDM